MFKLGDKVVTPLGRGVIKHREKVRGRHGMEVTGRYGIEIKTPNTFFGFLGFTTTEILYFWLGELKHG